MDIAKIEEWYIFDFEKTSFVFLENEFVDSKLIGMVYFHSKFKNGSLITSSRIKLYKNNTILTQNTVYILGKPSILYLDWAVKNGYNTKRIEYFK